MDVRQRTEEIEHMTFAPWATFSDQSRGRMLPEEQDPIRPVFQRDRDRVLHCTLCFSLSCYICMD